MFNPTTLYQAFSISSPVSLPHAFRIGGHMEVVFDGAHGEPLSRMSGVLHHNCSPQVFRDTLRPLAPPDIDIFFAATRGGQACFHVLSHHDFDESNQAIQLINDILVVIDQGKL